MFGLPPDAGAWREDFLPPLEERLAQLLERGELWQRALLNAQLGERIRVPAEVTIPRPGGEPKRKRVETDPAKIAQWFALNA